MKKYEACNFIKKGTLAQVFSYEFCEIFKNTSSVCFCSCKKLEKTDISILRSCVASGRTDEYSQIHRTLPQKGYSIITTRGAAYHQKSSCILVDGKKKS